MAAGDIRYTVTVDEKGAVTSIKRLDDEMEKLGKEAAETGKQTHAFGQKMSGLLPTFTAASLAADAIRGTLRGMKNAITDTVDAAIEQEDADRALRASLELTGRTVAGNYDHYKKFAEAQQLVTKFADEETQAAQNLLLQMTRLDQQGIDRATKGAMGLASVFKMDLQAAASLVQKAMEGNFGALGRYGIRVNESLTLEEKRADLLRQLDGLYGRATAATGTFSGKVTLLKNAWGEAQEEIGKAVTQNKGVQDLMQTVMNTIREFTPEIKEYVSGLAGFISGIASVVKATLTAIEDVRRAVGGARSVVSDEAAAWDTLNEKLGGFTGVTGAVITQYNRMNQYGKDSKPILDALWESFNMVGGSATLAAMAAGKFGKDIQDAFRVVGGESLKVAESLGSVKGKIDEVGDSNKNLAVSYKLLETAINSMPWGTHRAEYMKFLDGWFATEKVIEGTIPKVNKLSKEYKLLVRQAQDLIDTNPWDNLSEKVSAYAQRFNEVFSSLNTSFSQAQTNREISIENEYKKRLAVIEATVKDEEAKQKAIMALEAEFEIKRTSAKRAAAKQQKAIAMMEAVVNTADAVTKALAQGGFLLGIPWAAIVGALGAIQIGMIAAQPIPLARGAYFDKPTLMPGRDGNAYLGGEAAPEIMSPVPVMRSIVREELGRLIPALAGGGSFTLMGGIHIHTEGQVDGALIFSQLEAQARLRGFKVRR